MTIKQEKKQSWFSKILNIWKYYFLFLLKKRWKILYFGILFSFFFSLAFPLFTYLNAREAAFENSFYNYSPNGWIKPEKKDFVSKVIIRTNFYGFLSFLFEKDCVFIDENTDKKKRGIYFDFIVKHIIDEEKLKIEEKIILKEEEIKKILETDFTHKELKHEILILRVQKEELSQTIEFLSEKTVPPGWKYFLDFYINKLRPNESRFWIVCFKTFFFCFFFGVNSLICCFVIEHLFADSMKNGEDHMAILAKATRLEVFISKLLLLFFFLFCLIFITFSFPVLVFSLLFAPISTSFLSLLSAVVFVNVFAPIFISAISGILILFFSFLNKRITQFFSWGFCFFGLFFPIIKHALSDELKLKLSYIHNLNLFKISLILFLITFLGILSHYIYWKRFKKLDLKSS